MANDQKMDQAIAFKLETVFKLETLKVELKSIIADIKIEQKRLKMYRKKIEDL